MSDNKIFFDRVQLSKLDSIVSLPNLIEMQLDSYKNFLQMDIPYKKRSKEYGLENVFQNIFPIESPNKNVILEYHGYSFDKEKYTEEEAKENDATYSVMLKALIRMIYIETGEVREKEVYIASIPLMTNRGTFIINGSERVVVSQIHKSPGVIFNANEQKTIFSAKIIPEKGVWLEFEIDVNKELLHIKIDRKKGILITSFLNAIGCNTKKQVIETFYETQEVDLTKRYIKDIMDSGRSEIRLAEDIFDPQTKELIFEVSQEIISQDIEKILSFDIKKINIINPELIKDSRIILNCLDSEQFLSEEENVSHIYSILRPGEASTFENAKNELNKILFDLKRYKLGVVGRYKLNKKLYDENIENLDSVLSLEDIIKVVKYLIDVYTGKEPIDDIDHLGNRRIRCVGELLSNHLKIGFARMERVVKERMNTENIDEVTPQKLINTKPIAAVIKEFFGTSQLSQFMDQTNPLAELTHKRRLNALGPGGLSRERAGFEVRDVHYTHYGRVCPIETPEGPSIGLILSLCNYTKVNQQGFLITPYRKIANGYVTNEVIYLTSIEEDRCYIAQANAPIGNNGKLINSSEVVRNRGEFILVSIDKINYMDISSKQIISVSAALIPFLEHDDANRALMGSNMQRQAVPLVHTDSPIVGTGMEKEVAKYSGVCVLAKNHGEVIDVSSSSITVQYENSSNDKKENIDIYNLIKYSRTNQNTCFNQYPIVSKGDKITKGQIIADGPACQNGELALGRNVLVAFMCWEGYNFEDAIIVNERLIKEDAFTSVHIEEFQIDARETKLGSEKFTREIPNLNDDVFKNLDENGIIRVGSKVEAGDILIGKITPKGEIESTPEYKLLHSIFGEKVREIKDTSLRVPHGNKGTVIKVLIFDRKKGDELPPGVEMLARVYIAEKRNLQEGDKVAGRHGNKGIISKIVPEEDMPYFENGETVDIILNPLGVPSRMNIGQILETQLGWAGKKIKQKLALPVFESDGLKVVKDKLKEANLPDDGKAVLYDGKTGQAFDSKITVGYIYILKLAHMIDDKIHARSTGPYSLVTQQPLGGKAQFGGQRLGEMEVWALQAYGAAHTLQEFLTVKADDMMGRAKIYEDIVKGNTILSPGIPESFNVLLRELRGLGLDLNIYDKDNNLICLTDKDFESLNKIKNKQN